jgi:hypothetical protein
MQLSPVLHSDCVHLVRLHGKLAIAWGCRDPRRTTGVRRCKPRLCRPSCTPSPGGRRRVQRAGTNVAVRPAGDGDPGEKSQINALTVNGFPELPQPTIEWHLQRTFGEHGDLRPPPCADCAHVVSSAGIALMHEFRVNFSNARFRNVSDYAKALQLHGMLASAAWVRRRPHG